MRVAFRCDAGAAIGAGHVMRSVALAEELASRGARPVFVCDVEDVPWLRRQLDVRGYEVLATSTDVRALRPDAVVLDSYLLPSEVSRGWRAAGLPVLAIVDGDPRGQQADLYVDQNLGALPLPHRLAGLDYAMFRDAILACRPAAPREEGQGTVEVVAFFGGTDACGAAPVVTRTLAASGQPFTATVVAADDAMARAVRDVPLAPGQRAEVVPPTDRLPELMAAADLVVSAAGTSTWELMCLGAAGAIVRVADNQRVGYDRAVATGAVAGLGALADLPSSVAVDVLGGLLSSPADRAALRRRAWRLVDGRGRLRVADALTRLVEVLR